VFRKIGITLSLLIATTMPIFNLSIISAHESTNQEATTTSTPDPLSSNEANIDDSLCAGANLKVNADCTTKVNNKSAVESINEMIATVINFLSWVVGVVAVIMIIIGGFRYITSGGDSTNVTGAKNTILYAIIGLIIVAFAQWIVRFVLERVVE
jgi:hypothetical protein